MRGIARGLGRNYSRLIFVAVTSLTLAVVPLLSLVSDTESVRAADPDYVWTELSDGSEVYAMYGAMSADGSKVVSFGMDARISNDGGGTWRKIEGLPNGGEFYGLALMSSNGSIIVTCDGGSLIRSTDGGDTWVERALPGSSCWGQGRIGMARDDGDKLAYAAGDYIYTSDDIGDSWVQQAGSGEVAVGVVPKYDSVYVSGDGSRLVAVSDHYAPTGVYMSGDGGVTWVRNGDVAALKLEFVAVSSDLQTLYANSYQNSDYSARPLYVTTDGGDSWTETSVTGEYDAGFIRSDGAAILMRAEWSSYGERLTSLDDGVSWQSEQMDMPGHGVCDFTSTPDGSSMFIFDCYSTLKSSDGGSTWDVSLLHGEQWWASAATSADGSVVLVADADGNAYISHDGGDSWILRPMGDDLFGASMSDDGSVMTLSDMGPFASRGDKSLYISKDSGLTWRAVDESGAGGWGGVVVSGDGRTIAGVSPKDFHISHDGGETWSTTTDVVVAGGGRLNRIDMSSDGQNIVIAPNNAGRLYISHDGGETWSESQTGLDASWTWTDIAVSGDGSRIVGAGYNWGVLSKIIVSDDGGASWADWTSGDLPDMTSMRNNVSSVSLSHDGTVVLVSTFARGLFVSRDSGVSWVDYGDIQQDYYISGDIPSAMSADGSRLYVAGGSVFGASLASDGGGGSDPGPGDGDGGGAEPPVGGDDSSNAGGVGGSDSVVTDGDDGQRLASTGQHMGIILAISASLIVIPGSVAYIAHRLRRSARS